MKECSTCGKTKSEEEFNWKVKNEKRSGVCKVCHKAYRKIHYEKNKQKYIDKARAWEIAQGGKLFIRYGLTEDQILIMLAKYKGKCWLCQEKSAKVVDHDHACCAGQQTCGECVRGVLCFGCNTGLGALGDNLDGLYRAIVYLSK